MAKKILFKDKYYNELIRGNDIKELKKELKKLYTDINDKWDDGYTRGYESAIEDLVEIRDKIKKNLRCYLSDVLRNDNAGRLK